MSSRLIFPAIPSFPIIQQSGMPSVPGVTPLIGETEVRSVVILPNGGMEFKGWPLEDIRKFQESVQKNSRFGLRRCVMASFIGASIGAAGMTYVFNSLNKKNGVQNGGGGGDGA